MRKVVLTSSDFEMFDTDINSMEFEFFQKHKEAFKRMWIEQGKKFWIQFVITFRQFAVDYGAIKEFPAKNEQFEDFVDQAFIIIHEHFVDGKFGTARNLIMDIVMVAQHRHTLQYLESKSYAKDPFYNKETRDVFRRLFGAPTEKASYVKVYILLPLYMKYGGAVCVCLRRWLEAHDCLEDFDKSNLPVTKTSNRDETSETSKFDYSSSNSKEIQSENEQKNKEKLDVSGDGKQEGESKSSADSGKKQTTSKEISTVAINMDKSIQTDSKISTMIKDISSGSVKQNGKKHPPRKDEKDNKTNGKKKESNDYKKREFVPTEDSGEAFKQLEVLSKDLVQSMNGHPFIKSSSIKVKLESGSGKEDQCSTFHSDGRVEHDDKMDEAEAKFNALMKMKEEPIIHSDEFFKMYIDEVTKGSVLGPVHVPGWPKDEDPRFFDPENPLYDPASRKEEWKSNLKLGDFQNFVRYVLRNYKNGKKSPMVTLQTRFDLGDSALSKVKQEMPMSPEEIARKKDQEKVAKEEEEKRKKLEEERKRQKKIRKKLKKGLPLDKDALSGATTNIATSSSSSQKQDSDTCSKCKDCTHVDMKEPGNSCPVHKVVHKVPQEQSQLTDPRKPYIMDSKLKDKQLDSPPFHEPKLLEVQNEKDIPENEPNSVKLTKKVDEKAGTVSLTIEKRDQKGRLTKETTVKPLSENGSIWEEAMKKINNPSQPVLNDDVQKQLAEKLSQSNFFEESTDGSSGDMAEGLNSSSTWLQGDDMQEEDRRQFREMYCEISAAIADVSRQNMGEGETTICNHVKCNHDSRHEKARNRLRKKIGERRQDRRHPDLPGLLRLGGNVEYPGNEREAMMITLAEMTKMTPRERELFQERLGRTKYFKDCQEDPRDVADSMGACLFPGMKKTLTDQKSQQKKEKVRALEAKEEKEKQRKKSEAMLEESLNKCSDKEDNEEEELCMADVQKVIMYKDDVKRMKKDLHYSNIKLNHMMEKKKDNKEFIRTGREFDEQVRKASEDLRILEEKISILDKECAGLNNPEFNANVLKAAEELKAVKKKVEKWEADADVLNEKIDKFEKEGDVNALLEGESLDCVDEADRDTHIDKDELDYELSKRLGPIDQEKAFEDFKEVMGLTDLSFANKMSEQKCHNEVDDKDKKSSDSHSRKSSDKENKIEKEKLAKSQNKNKKKDKKKDSSKKGDDIYLEINERIAADFQCKIPDCIGCKALKKFPDGYPGGPPADLDGHGNSSSCASDEKDATQKFIEDLDSGALPPPPPGVSITVLQRVTEPVDVKPKCAINMGSTNPNSKEFKSYWKAAKHYGPTPPEKMLKDPQQLNLVITNTGTKEEPNINFGTIPTFGRDPSPPRKRKEKIQVKIARDRPLKREKTPSLTIEDVTELLKEEENKKKQSADTSDSKEASPGVEEKSGKGGDKSRTLKQCSGCDKSEPFPKAFKKCQKCKLMGVKAARYYCGRDCQVSDWKKRHKTEHSDNKVQ